MHTVDVEKGSRLASAVGAGTIQVNSIHHQAPDAVGEGPVSQRCRSVRGRYDVVAETVTVSFPAACIGKPKWIQVASGATRIQVTPIGDGSINLAGWADDAFRPSLSENSRGRCPKVRRG